MVFFHVENKLESKIPFENKNTQLFNGWTYRGTLYDKIYMGRLYDFLSELQFITYVDFYFFLQLHHEHDCSSFIICSGNRK